MNEKSKAVLTPSVWFNHDLENYYVQIELPGVAKEDIELTISEQSLCVRGIREDVDLLGCWYLAHAVVEDEAKAKYENGMLSVIVPLKKPLKGKRIPVE